MTALPIACVCLLLFYTVQEVRPTGVKLVHGQEEPEPEPSFWSTFYNIFSSNVSPEHEKAGSQKNSSDNGGQKLGFELPGFDKTPPDRQGPLGQERWCPSKSGDIPIKAKYKERRCDKPNQMWSKDQSSISAKKFLKVAEMLGWSDANRHATVLDLGSGCGNQLDDLKKMNPQLTLVGVDGVKDHEEYALNTFKNSIDAFCTYNIYEFSSTLPDDSVDFLISHGALFLSNYDDTKFCNFVADVARVLKSGGAVWLGYQWDKNKTPPYKTEAGKKCLDTAKLAVKRFEEESLFGFPVEYGWKTFSMFLFKGKDAIPASMEKLTEYTDAIVAHYTK